MCPKEKQIRYKHYEEKDKHFIIYMIVYPGIQDNWGKKTTKSRVSYDAWIEDKCKILYHKDVNSWHVTQKVQGTSRDFFSFYQSWRVDSIIHLKKENVEE